MALVSTIESIPIYEAQADLIDDGRENGDLAITLAPATFWVWFTNFGWTAITSTATSNLALRVERLERLLADVGDLLADD